MTDKQQHDKQQYAILVVEDNPGDYLLIEEQLLEQFNNPAIVHVTDFRKAKDLWLSGSQYPDVILLDLTLPDKSGEQLVNEMMKLVSPVPIIILTGFADIDFSKKSISLGISDYLVKDELSATILYKSILYAIERSKNQAALLESEKRYSDLFNLSPQPMWVFDIQTFRFVQVNKAATELYGYSIEEYLRMTIMDIKSKEDVPKVKEWIKNEGLSKGFLKRTASHYKKSGEIIEVEMYINQIVINHRNFASVIAIDVTERIEMEHKITKAIIRTQEEERYEIGSELHDNVCQILASSLMRLDFIKKQIAPEALVHFGAVKEYISLATNEIRDLSHRLAPAFFDDRTFEEAIEALIKNLKLNEQFDVTFIYSKELNKIALPTDLQLNLYRILQETLRNTIKYSKANILTIFLKLDNGNLAMQISDDGKGFDVQHSKTGIGLANIKRRAELFGGNFRINSAPGEGCTIAVHIPIEQKE